MFPSMDTVVGLPLPCPEVESSRRAAFPCSWSPGAWPAQRRGEAGRLGFESPGCISGCGDARLGRRHTCSLREVADSEVLARGKRCLGLFTDGLVYSSFTRLPLGVVLARGAARCLDLIGWVSPRAPQCTGHSHFASFLFQFVVKQLSGLPGQLI